MQRYKAEPEIKAKKKPIGRPFKKGRGRPENSGRKAGVTNRIPTLFKECIELATSNTGRPEPLYAPKMRNGKVVKKNGKPVLSNVVIGWKGTGKDGVVGYMEWLALHDTKSFVGLIARTMPLQVNTNITKDATVSSRFDGVDTAKMTLTELTVAFREAVGLTQPLPSKPKLVEHHSGMLLEGTVNKDEAA